MYLNIDKALSNICKSIATENKSLNEWSAVESSGMFQDGNYVGGFDADEKEFTFSYYDSNGDEWWFQLSLESIQDIASGTITEIYMRKP